MPDPTPTTWIIPDFDQAHSNGELRKKADGKAWFWVKCPVLPASVRRERLMRTADGRSAFAAYILLAQVAANGSPRGSLTRSGIGPLTPDDLVGLIGMPREAIDAAISLLCSNGWLKEVPFPVPLSELAGDDGGDDPPPSEKPAPRKRDSRSRSNGNGKPTPPAHIGLVGGSSSGEGGAGGDASASLAAMLRRAKVPDPHIPVIVGFGVTALQAASTWVVAKADTKVDTPGSVMLHRLGQAGSIPEATPKLVVAAASAGVVLGIGDTEIAGQRCGYNAQGVVVGGKPVATAAQLKRGEVEVW